MDDIRETLRVEYIRLCTRISTMQVIRQRIDAEEPVILKRRRAVAETLDAYGADDAWDANAVIASQFRLGTPTDFIVGLLNDNFDPPKGDEWTENAVEDAADILGIRRPPGWDADRADAQWAAVDIDASDDWMGRAYGLPDVVEKPEPLRLAAPQPPPVDFQKLHDGLLAKIGACMSNSDLIILSRGKQFRIDHEILSRERRDLSGAILAAIGEREEVVKKTSRKAHPHPGDPSFVPLKTPERVALLKEMWETTRLTKQEMADRLNDLHGMKMSSSRVGECILAWKIAESAAEVNRPPLPVIDEKYSEVIPEPEPPSFVTPSVSALASQLFGKEAPKPEPPPEPPRPVLTTRPEARAAVAGIVQANGASVLADMATIQAWGAQRGIITGKLDLDRVNKKRRDLGLPQFEIDRPQR